MTSKNKTKETLILLRIIKIFIQFNPYCTARDIVSFISSEKYGLQINLCAHSIGKLIRIYSKNPAYHWFNVEIIEGKGEGNCYYCDLMGDSDD